MRNAGDPRPSFETIDRRLAVAFLALSTALMAAIFVVGSGLYLEKVREERARLAEVIAHSMGPSFEVAKRAGEYRMLALARQMREGHLGLEYIRIVDERAVLVQAGELAADRVTDDAALLEALLPAPKGSVRVRALYDNEPPVTEVAYRLQGGYQGEWIGVLRVGIRGERTAQTLARAAAIIGGVLALLLLASWPIVRWVSRRLGDPIRALARDFEGVMAHAPLHITIEDGDGRIEKASATFRTAFGVPREQHPPAASVYPPEVLDPEGAPSPEVRLAVGGEERVLLTSRFPVSISPEGEVLRSGVIATDVTAWRQAQAQRDQLAAAMEHTEDLVLVTGPEQRVIYANRAFVEQTGRTKDQVLGRDPTALLFGEGGAATGDDPKTLVGTAVRRAQRFRGRVEVQREEAEPYLCDLLVSPIGEGSPRAFVWMGRDVSRESQLELQLRQSQKMEAVGRLAGGIAHDFNNLLTVINGVAALLLAEPIAEAQRANVSMVADAGRRAADLTRQLLAFSRRQVLELREIDLNSVVQATLPLLRSVAGHSVQLSFNPGKDLWITRADIGQIEQVLMNLAINAKDAMPDGGRISIGTENTTLDAGFEADGTEVSPGAYVVLTVADGGEGMDAPILAKIFEPFFTTKGVGKGTGLGLATVHGIVRQSGGHVFVFSTPGVGTTFRIALPRVFAPDDTTSGEDHTRVPMGDGEVLLVVDDDEATRAVIEQMLHRAGYAVNAAGSAAEALDWTREHGAPDLLLTDLVMPGTGGVELAETLGERYPELPTLFMSGYSAAAVDFGLEDASRLLNKPMSTPELLRAVRRAIDGLPVSGE